MSGDRPRSAAETGHAPSRFARFGLALAHRVHLAAEIIDAPLIRIILAPAAMQLGTWN